MDAHAAASLLSFLAAVPDPRSRRGRRHPLCAILALVCCGAPSCAARGVTRPSRNGRKDNSQPNRLADRQTQSIDQALVVGLVVEDPLARIAPAHDMIDGARVPDSQGPAHSYSLTPREPSLNRKPNLTPGTDLTTCTSVLWDLARQLMIRL